MPHTRSTGDILVSKSVKKYRVIRQQIWSRPEFQDYSIEKKLLWFYLETGTNSNQLGIFQFLPRYASLETGLSQEQIDCIMNEFVDAGLILYNRDTHEVAIFHYLIDQIVKGGVTVTSCLESDLKKVQDLSLLDAVIQYNLTRWDELVGTAQSFVTSIINNTDTNNKDSNSNDIEQNINDKELKNKELMFNDICLSTADTTVDTTVNTTVNTPNTDTEIDRHCEVGIGADPHAIPTFDAIVKYLKDNYYVNADLADRQARAFIKLNEKSKWSYLERSSWEHMLDNMLAKDIEQRYTAEAVENRKAEAKAKAEADRKEQERQAENERIQHERENYFRHDWNERVYVNTSKDLLNYIKSRRYTEYDYSLCSCLYDKLYVQHTLEEMFVEMLFDKNIIAWDEVSNCIELNDYGIADTQIKRAVEKIKNDAWSEQYKPHLPELPKDDTPRSNAVIDDWQT